LFREPLNERKFRLVSKVYDCLTKELKDPLPLKELGSFTKENLILEIIFISPKTRCLKESPLFNE